MANIGETKGIEHGSFPLESQQLSRRPPVIFGDINSLQGEDINDKGDVTGKNLYGREKDQG